MWLCVLKSNRLSLSFSLLPLLLLVGAFGVDDHRCTENNEDAVYDYVVVGAGTAGSAVAAVLAKALPDAQVLVMDQGKDYSDLDIVMNNDKFPEIQRTPYCEHQFSAERGLVSPGGWASKRDIYMCVPKILGGASAINYGGWYRTPASDLDEWDDLSDGAGVWSYEEMLPIFERLERVTVASDEQKERLQDRFFDGVIPVKHQNVSALYARTGLLKVVQEHFDIGLENQNNNARLQAGMNTLEVTRVEDGCWHDKNGEQLGCAKNMRNGSSYNAFVRDPQRHGHLSNLVVMEGAKVVKVDGIFDDDDDNEPVTIHYIQKGHQKIVKARHEVILSAGSWGNPKIAMLSGIGNQTELTQAGIQTKIDSPAVGRIKDHAVLWIRAILNNLQDTAAATVQTSATASRAGSNATTTATEMDFLSFKGVDNSLPALLSEFNSFNFFFKSKDSLEYPDMEFLGGVSQAGPRGGFMGMRLYQNKGASGSGGYMRLRSDDPNEDMDVSRNFFATEASIEPMLNSLKKAIAMVQNLTKSHAAMMIEPNTFTIDVTDDNALKKYIRDNVVSEMHMMSSMRMGTVENGAVVDKHLKIIGSNGRIRVADTSIFPDEMRGHPMSTAMAVGIKAADIIVANAPPTFKVESSQNADASSSAKKGGFSFVLAVLLYFTTIMPL